MCMYELSKLILCIFNFVLWAAGVTIFGIGIYLIVGDDIDAVVSIAGINFYYTGAYILMISGACMLILGFCGCCGVRKESTLLLKLYFCFLLVLFVLEFGIGIWALVVYDDIPDAVYDGMQAWEEDMINDPDPISVESFQSIQRTFQCCGNTNSTGDNDIPSCDMWNSIYGKNQTAIDNSLETCKCDVTQSNNATCALAPSCTAHNTTLYTEGCDTAVVSFVEDNITLIAAFGLAFGLVEVFGMLITCYVINEMKK